MNQEILRTPNLNGRPERSPEGLKPNLGKKNLPKGLPTVDGQNPA